MTMLLIIPGLLLPTLSGWLLLRLVESESPVLFSLERWILSFLFGSVLTMFVTFFLHIGKIVDFTVLGFLIPQIIIIGLLGFLWWRNRARLMQRAPAPLPSEPLAPWMKIVFVLLGVWTALKMVAAFGILTLSPPYFDDVLTNWNMKGKVFYFLKEYSFIGESGGPTGTGAYPPAVPMLKAWLASLAGGWHEGLVNLPHFLWYVAAVVLLYFLLRRSLSVGWSLVGAYILSSLPLFLMHGATAYADGFLAAHILPAVGMLYLAALERDPGRRRSFLSISAVATGLLVFTKNEALLLELPPILLLLATFLWLRRKSGSMEGAEIRRTIVMFALCIAVILIPWLIFKWSNGLTFGNAKPISGLDLSFHPMVLPAIAVNIFLEGNWALLPIVLVGLLIGRRAAFRTPLVYLTAFFLIVFLGELPIFLFTPISVEALTQTGYARGLIHLAPIVVAIVTLLLHDVSKQKSVEKLEARS